MGQYGTDIHFMPIVVYSSNQSYFIATNVEDGEFPHFICCWKYSTHFRHGSKIASLHVLVPVLKSCSGVRVSRAKSFKRFRVMMCIPNGALPISVTHDVWIHWKCDTRLDLSSSRLFSASCQRLVVPHEELLVFLEDALRDAASYGDDGAIVAIAIAVCEAGTDRLHTNDSEWFSLRNRGGPGFQSGDEACFATPVGQVCTLGANIPRIHAAESAHGVFPGHRLCSDQGRSSDL